VQTLIDALKALLGDMGSMYDMVYMLVACVVFLLVFVMVLSAVIRIIDRR
jgi:hypothetical protein